MLEDPNLIKRPLIEKESGALIQGYDESRLAAFLR
jgi:arsenate reductase-like glutaredoxin family protein